VGYKVPVKLPMVQNWPILKKQGKRPLLVACDIYRPAAISN
jgi:hypothetical protein